MTHTSTQVRRAGVRAIAVLGLLTAVLLAAAGPANALGTVTLNPNPVVFTSSQIEATATVNWSGQPANKLMFVDICKKSIADPTFNVALDCGAYSQINPVGTASGAGSTALTVFRGQDPAGEAWGCFAAGDQAPSGVTKFTTCYVRVTNNSSTNNDDDTETAFTLTVSGDVVPEAPVGVILPIAGAVMAAGAFLVLRRRSALSA